VKNPIYPRGRIKGATIREFIAWHLGTHGHGPLERAIRLLAPDEQARFDVEAACLGVLPSDWFPAEIVHAVLDHLTQDLDEAAYEALVQGAAEATVKGLMTGVQRVVFSTLLTPGVYVKVANLAFRLNYDEGRVLNEELGPKRHKGTVEGWTSHHPFLCRMNVSMKAGIYRTMSCSNVRIEQRYCRSDGDSDCGSIIAWD
jgi:hypothetical protein